jgi:cytochrome P450
MAISYWETFPRLPSGRRVMSMSDGRRNMGTLFPTKDFCRCVYYTSSFDPSYSHFDVYQQPVLMVTDLRALSHVLNHTEVYQKPGALIGLIKRMLGSSILVAEDEIHRAQRKVLNPAFGPAQLRDQTGIFLDKANEVRHVVLTLDYYALSHCTHSSRMF